MTDFDIGTVTHPWNVTGAISAVSATTGAAATKAAATKKAHAITHFSGSASIAALFTIESPSGTTLWQKRLSAAGAISECFDPPLMVDAANQAVVLRAAGAATMTAEVNGVGVSVTSG